MTAPAPVMPWVHPAVRAILLADNRFLDLVGNRLSSRLGTSVILPCATLQSTAIPINVSAGVWSPLVQLDGWCPATATGDPEGIVWDIAVAGAVVLDRVRNQPYQNMHFSARVVDGPQIDIDESRGKNNVLYRAFIRAELTVHAR